MIICCGFSQKSVGLIHIVWMHKNLTLLDLRSAYEPHPYTHSAYEPHLIHTVHMSPTLNGSSALQHFEHSNAIEI